MSCRLFTCVRICYLLASLKLRTLPKEQAGMTFPREHTLEAVLQKLTGIFSLECALQLDLNVVLPYDIYFNCMFTEQCLIFL